MENGTGCNRVGVTVDSRRVPLSVHRNRSKRLLLESFRDTEGDIKIGYDMVFLTRGDISGLKKDDVKKEVIKLYRRSGMDR
jgi:ribonuclease P protein component